MLEVNHQACRILCAGVFFLNLNVFMVMGDYLFRIFIGLLLIYCGWRLLNHADQLISKEDLLAKEQHCESAATTMGVLTGTIKETVVDVGKIKTRMYEYNYVYDVEGKSYRCHKVTNRAHPKDSTMIWYSKQDASVSSTIDPCEELASYREGRTVGNSTWYYVSGGLALLIGISLSWGSFKTMIVNAVRGKK